MASEAAEACIRIEEIQVRCRTDVIAPPLTDHAKFSKCNAGPEPNRVGGDQPPAALAAYVEVNALAAPKEGN
jgi:hypothetical protein